MIYPIITVALTAIYWQEGTELKEVAHVRNDAISHDHYFLLQTYMAPSMAQFGDIHLNPWNNFRVYGTCLVVLLTLIVAVGVKFVQYFAPISLACVIISISSITIGAFEANAATRQSL